MSLNADGILSSLAQDVTVLGQGGTKLLLSKAQDAIDTKVQTAVGASATPAPSASSSKSSLASSITPARAAEIAAAAVLVLLAAWKVFRRSRGR